METVPTAENMAAEAFRILQAEYQDTYGNHLKLERVRRCLPELSSQLIDLLLQACATRDRLRLD